MGAIFPQTRRFLAWLFAYAGAYFGVFFDAARNAPALMREPGRRVLLKQIYFTGLEALPLLTLIAIILGFAALSPLYNLLQETGLALDVFRLLVLHEASILVVAFFVLARSGSAIASELASARQQGEIASLYRMGIDAGAYLVTPRVAGCVLSVAALTVYFQVAMVFGGISLMSVFSNWDFAVAMGKFAGGLQPASAILSLFKAGIFGAIIGTISCQQGLLAVSGPLGIPVATRTAMVHGFGAIVVTEGLFVALVGR
ncbi:MAG: ABC transporter permease [Chthoniobacterales bacterium]|nr:ABC transporter permease [Chthoniobacterales bacterium]